MPSEPRCTACGGTDGLERHHLYSVKDGCPDDLRVWLCHVCHERVHGHSFGGIEHGRLVREGIAKAKARGVRFGRKTATGEKTLTGAERQERHRRKHAALLEFARAAYRDNSKPVRRCDHCNEWYRGPAVFCSLECALAAA